MCLTRQLFGTMIPHALSIGALVIAMVEPCFQGAPITHPCVTRSPPPPLAAAGRGAVDLAAIAAATDPELNAALTARSWLQCSSASSKDLDATLDLLHSADCSRWQQVQLSALGT